MVCKLYLNQAILEEDKWRTGKKAGEREEGRKEEEKDQGNTLQVCVEKELNLL